MGSEENRILGGGVYGMHSSGRGASFGVVDGDNDNSGVGCEIDSGEIDSVLGAASMVFNARNNEFAVRNTGTAHLTEMVGGKTEGVGEIRDDLGNFVTKSVGCGYEVGDLVWGKVKSHPWWPGQIFNEAFALHSVCQTKKEGNVLVAFFGDASYGWFDPIELIPFHANFIEKSKQSNSRAFVNAVEETENEASRRAALGLACCCWSPSKFHRTSVKDFFAVDVGGYEPGGLYSVKQIKSARDRFRPIEMLSFLQQLALMHSSHLQRDVDWIKNKAIVLAYRRTVFREFDETYAQAFRVQPISPTDYTGVLDQREKLPSQASLSDLLEIAEAPPGSKSSARPIKVKDHHKGDKYLHKQMERPEVLRVPQVGQGQQSFLSPSMYEEAALTAEKFGFQRRDPPVSRTSVFLGQEIRNDTFGSMGTTLSPCLTDNEATTRVDWDPNRAEMVDRCQDFQQPQPSLPEVLVTSSNMGEYQKSFKRPGEDLSSKKAVMVDRKKKKKKEPKLKSGLEHSYKQLKGATNEALARRSAGKYQSGLVCNGDSLDKQGKGSGAPHTISSDSVATMQMFNSRNIDTELPQLFSDLLVIAFDPFHGMEQNLPAKVRKFFLQFRSIVYEKKLVGAPEAEAELIEPQPTKSPACTVAAESSPSGSARDLPFALKPPKKRLKPDYNANAGQDSREISMKRLKNLNVMKSLTAEQKAGNMKLVKSQGKDQKVMDVGGPTKLISNSLKRPESSTRAAEPTMLVMQFPHQSALPSVPELKARFARFGPLEHSSTRVFYRSSTCRVIFKHKSDARAAYGFAVHNRSLFGNVKVKYRLRTLEVYAPVLPGSGELLVEEAPGKVPQLMSLSTGNSAEARSLVLQHRPSHPRVNLKSCLKKTLGEEARSRIGGCSETPHVKFMVGGNDCGGREHFVVSSNMIPNSNHPSGNSSSSHATFNTTVSDFQNIVLPPPLPALPSLHNQIPNVLENNEVSLFVEAVNVKYHQFQARNHCTFNATTASAPAQNLDISHQMLNLMMKCNGIVADLKCSFGCVPYHLR